MVTITPVPAPLSTGAASHFAFEAISLYDGRQRGGVMKRITLVVAGLACLMSALVVASGPIGVYGIVEKVVFEPSAAAPERIQVWGAFAYADIAVGPSAFSPAKRGYMYFRLPESATPAAIDTIKKEWADLQSVAGTGQAIAFGQWGYIGGFGGLQPDTRSQRPPYILESSPGNPQTDLRVRPASETPAGPAQYQTNAGIVKLSDTGSHAAIVQLLKDTLKR